MGHHVATCDTFDDIVGIRDIPRLRLRAPRSTSNGAEREAASDVWRCSAAADHLYCADHPHQGSRVFELFSFLAPMKLLGLLLKPIVRLILDRKSTRLNSSHIQKSRMPSSA